MQLAILWCCINYLLEKCRFFCCSRKAVSSAVAGLTPLDASTTHAVSRARIGRAACVSWTLTRLLPTERSYRMHGVHTVVPRVRVGTNCPSICFPRTFDSLDFTRAYCERNTRPRESRVFFKKLIIPFAWINVRVVRARSCKRGYRFILPNRMHLAIRDYRLVKRSSENDFSRKIRLVIIDSPLVHSGFVIQTSADMQCHRLSRSKRQVFINGQLNRRFSKLSC